MRFDFETSDAASAVEYDARESAFGSLFDRYGAALGDRVRERHHRAHVGERDAGLGTEAQRDREVDLPLDPQLAVEGERVEGDRHRALDHVLDRHQAGVEIAVLDTRDDVGNGPLGRPFARREVVLGEERLLGERPRRTEVRDRSHRQIVFGAPERPRRHCPDRCNVRGIGVWSVRVVLTTRSLQTRRTTDERDAPKTHKEAAMRAALFTETGGPLTIEDLEPTAPGPRDVVVELGASGVCHSDLSLKNGYVGIMPGTILGHEGAGKVLEVGGEVTKVKAGDRIIASFIPACGTCWFCLHDSSHLCDNELAVMMSMRGSRPDGSQYMAMTGLGTFAEQMTCNESSIVKVDTDLPDEQLALIGCGVTTGVGAALNTANVQPGTTVAVIGCGGVGQAVIQGARIAGASRIIAVDPVELKRKTAEQLGATDHVDPNEGDPVAQVQQLTGGRGVDYAFEVIGLPETTLQAYNMIRKGGTAVMVGMTRADAQVTIPTFDLFFNEKTLKGSKYGSGQVRRDFQRFIDLIETGRLDTGAMVSKTIKLDEVNDAFTAMEKGEVIRSVITSF